MTDFLEGVPLPYKAAGVVSAAVLVAYSAGFFGVSGETKPVKQTKKAKKAKAPAVVVDDEKKKKKKKKKAGGGGGGNSVRPSSVPLGLEAKSEEAVTAGGKKKKKNRGTPEEREARRTAEVEKALVKAQKAIKEGKAESQRGSSKHDDDDDEGFTTSMSKSSAKARKRQSKTKSVRPAAAEAAYESKASVEQHIPVGMVAPSRPSSSGPSSSGASKPSCGDCGNCGICCGGGDPAAAEAAKEEPKISATVMVDARKLGAIIGPGGETLHAIQDKTETRINLPARDQNDRGNTAAAQVRIEGTTKEGVQAARKAVDEINKKGYCLLLAPEDFTEAELKIPAQFIGILMGTGGIGIRTLQDRLNVKVSLPKNNRGAPQQRGGYGVKPKEKVTIAGPKEGVALAKQAVKDICTFYHSEYTHPGFTHAIVKDIEPQHFSFVIGQRGSVIKHIQNNFKVKVNIPDDDATSQGIIVVGLPQNVAAAVTHMHKVVARALAVDEEPEAGAAGAVKPKHQQDDDFEEPGAHEGWMDEYMYRR